MTEDQSYEGRRRLYYDAEKDETAVCSESDEDLEAEEYKHDFKPEDDTIILGTIEEHGLCQLVLNELSSLLKVKPADIKERFLELQEKRRMRNSIEGTEHIQNKPKLETIGKSPEDLKDLMDTCDNLFCRRCLVFDCRLHGNEIIPEPHEKQPPSLREPGPPCGPNCHLQPAHASLLEQLRQSLQNWAGGGHKKSSTGAPMGGGSSSAQEVEGQEGEGKPSEERLQEGHGHICVEGVEQVEGGGGKVGEEDENWSKLERQLCDKGVQMYGYDSCRIARSLNGLKSCVEIEGRLLKEMARRRSAHPKISTAGDGDEENVGVSLQRRQTRRRGKQALTKSGRSRFRALQPGGLHFLRKDKNGRDLRSHYTPCACKGQCNRTTCTCFANGNVCEKYCACSKQCKQRFPGCQCGKSLCGSRQCPCFAADRECDPDVCKNCWLGCGDGTLGGPQPRSESFQCKNMKVLLRQHQRIILGQSDVQGWGAFLKTPVAKNEYIGEYTGELISHQEADRRGKIYDRVNSSFLFDLDDQYVLDACRRGNKLKFANHSATPNCYAKVAKVAGDQRVGIFSKEKISAGDELFYDYGYTPDQAPPWWETAAEGSAGNNLRRNTKAV